MDVPFHYDHADALVFGGALPIRRRFADSAIVVLPVPVDRTTSYVGGTRNGPHEILQASSHMELWDEELKVDVHGVGICTLPEMELPFGEMEPLLEEIERVVDSLSETVYVTIDVDGFDPSIMPATGTPEPGGLSWTEITALVRAVAERRRIVAADMVELSPIPGLVAPNFLAAKLIYKLLTYKFASHERSKRI